MIAKEATNLMLDTGKSGGLKSLQNLPRPGNSLFPLPLPDTLRGALALPIGALACALTLDLRTLLSERLWGTQPGLFMSQKAAL